MFLDLTLEFEGTDYKVPSNKVFGLIRAVELVVSAEDLAHKRLGAISDGYSAALNYAGGNTTGEQIHMYMIDDFDAVADRMGVIYTILVDLICMPKNLQKMQPKKKPVTKKKVVRQKKP